MKETIKIWAILVPTLLFVIIVPNLVEEDKAVVERVIDGDTIFVKDYGTIRIADIDAPELDTDKGRIAKTKARDLLLGKEVVVKAEKKRGYYGRIIAEVFVDDLNFGQYMLDNGYAIPY